MELDTDQKLQTSNWFDLRPNRSLLDPNFEGFKLSLDTFVQYKLDLDQDLKLNTYNFIESSESKHKFLLYQHLKLFGMHNLIIANQFNDSNLYYFDCNQRLVRIVYNLPKLVPQRAIMPTNLQLTGLLNSERTCITMKFVNETTAVIFDGFDSIYICQIDEATRSENPLVSENWNILFKWQLNEAETTCVLKDAILYENTYHLLLINVVESQDKSSSTNKFDTMVNWLSIENSANNWSLKRVRKLNCFTTVPEYISLETNGQSIYLAGPSFSKFIYDSEVEIQTKPAELCKKPSVTQMETDVACSTEKFYTWSQTADEIIVKVRLDTTNKELNKNDVKINLRLDSIEISYLDELILSGHFSSVIKLDESVWTLNNANNAGLVELSLTKANSGEIWPFLMKDQDKFGAYKQEVEVNFCNEFTPETLEKSAESKSLFALDQQLEECDGIINDQAMSNVENDDMFTMLLRLDGNTHQVTHKSYINDNKFLFEVKLSGNKSPALCLRHDVDGIVWQPHRVSAPSPTETVWLTHEYSFLAFGYVQASKQDTKFRSCPPDCSYVSIIDTKRHIYVYKQDSEKVETQLKNRKTGKMVTHVAKQYLISLDNDSEIYGAYCSNDYMIVLLKDVCYVFKINPNSN